MRVPIIILNIVIPSNFFTLPSNSAANFIVHFTTNIVALCCTIVKSKYTVWYARAILQWTALRYICATPALVWGTAKLNETAKSTFSLFYIFEFCKITSPSSPSILIQKDGILIQPNNRMRVSWRHFIYMAIKKRRRACCVKSVHWGTIQYSVCIKGTLKMKTVPWGQILWSYKYMYSMYIKAKQSFIFNEKDTPEHGPWDFIVLKNINRCRR